MQSVFQVPWLMRGGNKLSSRSPVELQVKHIQPSSLLPHCRLFSDSIYPFQCGSSHSISESLSLNLLSNLTCPVPFQMPTLPFVLPSSFISQSIIPVLPTAHSPTMVMLTLPSVNLRSMAIGWSPSIDPKQVPSWLCKH